MPITFDQSDCLKKQGVSERKMNRKMYEL